MSLRVSYVTSTGVRLDDGADAVDEQLVIVDFYKAGLDLARLFVRSDGVDTGVKLDPVEVRALRDGMTRWLTETEAARPVDLAARAVIEALS